jgi:hypothetical protein
MYREIILNSEDFNRGNRNHPTYVFPEELRFERFCIKSVEFPNFYLNQPDTEHMGIIAYDAAGAILTTKYVLISPVNYPTVAALVTALNTWISATTPFPGSPVFAVKDNYWITLTTGFTAVTFAFDFSGSQQGSPIAPTVTETHQPAKFMRRLFGYPDNLQTLGVDNVTAKLDAQTLNVNTIGALKPTRDNYLLLKSNCMSGATYTPNSGYKGSHANANVLAKIPINQGTFPYGTYVFYQPGDNTTDENMFSYNGGQTTKFDLFFTRPSPALSEDVVDFQGWNFSVTIGLITYEAP